MFSIPDAMFYWLFKVIGIVKLSLHPFYLSFKDTGIVKTLLKSQVPFYFYIKTIVSRSEGVGPSVITGFVVILCEAFPSTGIYWYSVSFHSISGNFTEEVYTRIQDCFSNCHVR